MQNKQKGARGGARQGAGRPPIENKRTMRGIKCNDAEWALITARAKERGLSIRAYILSLVENDKSQL